MREKYKWMSGFVTCSVRMSVFRPDRWKDGTIDEDKSGNRDSSNEEGYGTLGVLGLGSPINQAHQSCQS